MIPSRELVAKPSTVWSLLKKQGAVVITKNGHPEGIFVSTSEETWIDDIEDILRTRSQRAVSDMRRHARKNGISNMSTEDIDAEIQAVRTKRKIR